MTITLDGDTGDISAGGNGQDGDIIIRNTSATERIRLDGQTGSINARSAAMVMVFSVNGDTGEVILQGVNAPGHGSPRIRFQPGGANVWLGGNGQDGDLVLFGLNGDNTTLGQSTIHLNGGAGDLRLGGNNTNGDITMQTTDGRNRIRLEAGGGNIWLGGNGADGDLVIFKKEADNQTTANASIHLDGQAGDIVLRNADCAEEFDVADHADVEPGTVLVITDTGQLAPSDHAYDTRVAGVVSGAGGLQPGIRLGRLANGTARTPVALVGKVFCKVDAAGGPIEVGSLLTTSDTPGHAMRVSSPSREVGTVLGKALAPHHHGLGLIPILVTLQ